MVAPNNSVGFNPRLPSSSPPSMPMQVPSNPGLRQRLAEAMQHFKRTFAKAIGVTSTHVNVICPEHSVVKVCTVKSGIQVMTPINANKMTFSRCDPNGRASTPKMVIAGQSPQELNLCEHFLVQGIDSGRGLFQFVSRKAHNFSVGQSTKKSSETPIISFLDAKMKSGEPVVLGGRFTVHGFKPVDLPGITSRPDHCCYELTVQEGMAAPKTVHLTQAGLAFSNNLLRADEIKKADALVSAHLKFDRAPPAAEFAGQTDPMIISHAGIGRNAALIVYREMMLRVADGLKEENIDVALVDVVINGREGRGPMFLHSQAQLDEVREMLVDEIRARDAKGSVSMSATLPGSGNRSTTRTPPDAVGRGKPATIDETGPSSRAQHNSRLLRQDTVRSTLANLIEAQRDKHPLQVFENLARSNRQVAALASVIAAQAEVDPDQERQCQGELFIRTGLDNVERQQIQTSYSEPEYRVLLAKPKSTWRDRKTAPPPLMKTKSELLADRLVDALNAHPATDTENDQQATDCCEGDVPSLHQRLMSNAPFSITDRNEGAPVALTNAQRFEKTPTDVAALVCSLGHLPHAEFIRQIAAKNEDAATFLNFVSHGLLVKDSAKSVQLERYPYIDDDAYLREKIRDTGNPFVPTFIDGVERNFRSSSDGNDTWRIQTGDQWQEGQSRRDVLNHVLVQAIEHLKETKRTSPTMPIYPLVVYELLATAIGCSVPDYLKEKEVDVLRALEKNRAEEQRRIESVAKQQSNVVPPEVIAAKNRARFEEMEVSNINQWQLCLGMYERRVASESSDTIIPLSRGTQNLKPLAEQLGKTHSMQEISSIGDLCWLRSSWLSVLASIQPEELARRLTAISTNGGHGLDDAPILKAIAHMYRDDPVGFMRGSPSPEGPSPSAKDNLRNDARLGQDIPLSRIPQFQSPSGALDLQIKKSPEGFLKLMQLEIAAAFRPNGTHDRDLMDELERLLGDGQRATANLPLTLHRAFNLPLLVVEFDSKAAQMRVAAPNGSDIARVAEQQALNASTRSRNQSRLKRLSPFNSGGRVDENNIAEMLEKFKDHPVLWLDTNHYSLYLPNRMT